MSVTRLLPAVTHYGYLEELALKAVLLAESSNDRRIQTNYYNYGFKNDTFRVVKSIITPGFELHFCRAQSVIENTGLNNMAGLERIEFPATGVRVSLASEFYNFCVDAGIDHDYRPEGCSNQWTRYHTNLLSLPQFLTPRGWNVGDTGEAKFVVTAEALAAIATHLKRCLDELSSKSPALTISGPKIPVHTCRAEFYPGKSVANGY